MKSTKEIIAAAFEKLPMTHGDARDTWKRAGTIAEDLATLHEKEPAKFSTVRDGVIAALVSMTPSVVVSIRTRRDDDYKSVRSVYPSVEVGPRVALPRGPGYAAMVACVTALEAGDPAGCMKQHLKDYGITGAVKLKATSADHFLSLAIDPTSFRYGRRCVRATQLAFLQFDQRNGNETKNALLFARFDVNNTAELRLDQVDAFIAAASDDQ